jgi:hypothetical protein
MGRIAGGLSVPDRRGASMPSSTATISKNQRDGLYALVRNHLGGLGDVFVEMEQRKDFDAAERLGREFAEDFRLLDDIGWQPNDGREAVALTMPLRELSKLLQRLQDEAERLLAESPAERRSREEDEATNRRFRLGLDACEGVLVDLDREGG